MYKSVGGGGGYHLQVAQLVINIYQVNWDLNQIKTFQKLRPQGFVTVEAA